MIEIRHRQILIDRQPRLILSGEIHYFRLSRSVWQDRLDQLKEAGCNAVASYIPWLCHEPVEGQIDLEGRTQPELDLGAFIDLCHQNRLWFLARPGPFVMAEMKNEGLPYWLYTRYPEIIPVGWDGHPASTRTVDYLALNFLKATQHWYAAVARILTPRLQPGGGNVIALQLDNEIGMLSWCSNSPDLTDHLLIDFASWLNSRYEEAVLQVRYPFMTKDFETFRKAIRSPEETYAVGLLKDLGYYMRHRFARYVAQLRSYAEAAGIRDIPFLINIHGTGSGRGFMYPIGLSQLYEAYTQDEGYQAGTDYYFGNLTPDNFQDLYLCNAFTKATLLPEQALMSLEFECGNGDYGGLFGNRFDPSAVDFKLRMCIAQGHRLVNFYLFAGGFNRLLEPPPNDGDDRIAITGERHGIAAPINPEGVRNYTFPRMARSIHTVVAVADLLATMREEWDSLAIGFIPDYYMTEYCYPYSSVMREIIENLKANRAYGAWETLVRAMLLNGYRFGAWNLQNRTLVRDSTTVLVIPSARYMADAVQQKLADWLQEGGGLFLYGEVPLYDMEGKSCTILADALGVLPLRTRHSEGSTYLSLFADGWAAPRAEVRTHFAQVFETGKAQALLRLHGSNEVCGFETQVGPGRAVVIATAYPCDVELFRTALERLGACTGFRHDCPDYGIFLTSTVNDEGERFLHLLNLDGFDKEFHLMLEGEMLFEGQKLWLRSRDALMLPLGISFNGIKIKSSTAELIAITQNTLAFRLTQPEESIVIESDRPCLPSQDYTMISEGRLQRVTPEKYLKSENRLELNFG